MTEQQKIPPWIRFYGATNALCRLLEYDLDETINPAEFSPTKMDLATDAAVAIWWLTGQEPGIWARERGRFPWTVRELVRELRDNIRGWLIRLFLNPTPEQFDVAVPDQAQCYRLNVDTFLSQGHDESDFTDKLRLVVGKTEHGGDVCFMLEGSAQNLGKLWADILEPSCRLLMEELIYSTKQVGNLTLILLSDDPVELVLSRCISECLAIGARPHIGLLRFITARLLGVVF